MWDQITAVETEHQEDKSGLGGCLLFQKLNLHVEQSLSIAALWIFSTSQFFRGGGKGHVCVFRVFSIVIGLIYC